GLAHLAHPHDLQRAAPPGARRRHRLRLPGTPRPALGHQAEGPTRGRASDAGAPRTAGVTAELWARARKRAGPDATVRLKMKQLLVINPNTSKRVSALLQTHVQAAAGLHVQVRTVTARFGAPYIADEASYAVAAHA